MHKYLAISLVLATIGGVLPTHSTAQTVRKTIQGRGDDLTEILTLPTGLVMIGGAYRGQGNFVVHLLSADGENGDLVVNTIGDYRGVRMLPVAEGDYRLQVRADQEGTLMVEEVDPSAPGEPLPATIENTRDVPLGPLALPAGLLRATISHKDAANFVLTLYGSDGGMIGTLVNEIGEYGGTVSQRIQEAGSYWLAVRADGPWSIRLEIDQSRATR